MSVIISLQAPIDTRDNYFIDATLSEIIKEILALFGTDSSTDHHLLKQECDATKLASETSVEDYVFQSHLSDSKPSDSIKIYTKNS